MLAEEQSRKRFKATAIVKPDPDVPVQALAASAATATAHVEVAMRQRGSFTLAVEQCLIQFLRQRTTIYDAAKWSTDTTTIPGLAATGEQGGDVLSISISAEDVSPQSLDLQTACFEFHDYVASRESPIQHTSVVGGHGEGEAAAAAGGAGAETITPFSHMPLPSIHIGGAWESLIFDAEIKTELLQYVSTAIKFSDAGVDPSIISFNRCVLLHGPPGTGKTTLCKALSNKLAIRMNKTYSRSRLVEINAHSLFSKWFSESGKLVMKMFDDIKTFADSGEYVFVLMDEVESLTAARQASIAGSEPSDAVRVVNALLTQLDQLKAFPNVLVLATSNLLGAIDDAFLDRADIVRYIGNPSVAGRFQILKTCIQEMMRRKLVVESGNDATLFSYKTLERMSFAENATTANSMLLLQIAQSTDGCSGRWLRKLPFLAFATLASASATVSLDGYLRALCDVSKQQQQQSGGACGGVRAGAAVAGSVAGGGAELKM